MQYSKASTPADRHWTTLASLAQFAEAVNKPLAVGWRAWFQYLLVVIGCALLLASRQLSQITTPQLILEDGRIFFADAFNHSFFQALLIPYAGYYHLIPRLIAEAGSVLPYHLTPLFYNLCALLITSLAFGWFALPFFRHMVVDAHWRLLLIVILIMSPNVEALMSIAYLQWYVALWATLTAFMIVPANRICQFGILLFYLLAIGTTPALIVLVPIWSIRLFYGHTRSQRVGILLIILAQLAVSLFTVKTNVHLASFLDKMDQIGLEIVRGFSYKVVALALIGEQGADWLYANWGWLSLHLVTFIVIVLAVWGISRQPVGVRQGASLLLLYFMGAAFALYLLRVPLFGVIFENGVTKQAARYFFLSNAALVLLLFVCLDSWQHQSTHPAWPQSVTGLLSVGLLLAHLPTFYAGSWGYTRWPTYAALLETVKPQQRQAPAYLYKMLRPGTPTTYNPDPRLYHVYLPGVQGETMRVNTIDGLPIAIPIQPKGWSIELYVPKSERMYQFVEGPTLLGLTYRVLADQVTVQLVWQGSAWSDGFYEQHYTAYVHLVNQNGERVSGYDTVLDSSTNNMNASLFFTDHPLALPATMPTGEYHLEIGLYHWEHDKLIEGGAVALEPSFKLIQHS